MTFPGFTSEALGFLSQLKDNNTRDWFAENKKTYEFEMKNPTKIFASEMVDAIEKLTSDQQKSKIFRFNRDIRFSKDKTPYNTHVHISWMPIDVIGCAPAFMFGLGTDYLTLGCGVFEFDKASLVRFRDHVASESGSELESMLTSLLKSRGRLSEPVLKKIPTGYPKDHPRGDLLRHKGVAAWFDMAGPDDAMDGGLVEKTISKFRKLLPLYEALKQI